MDRDQLQLPAPGGGIPLLYKPTVTPAEPPACLRADLLAEFLRGKKPETVAAYSKDLRHFARFLGATGAAAAMEVFLGLDAPTAHGCVLRWRNDQVDAGLSSATIARRLAAVRSLVKLARQLGRVAWAVEVDPPKPEPRRDVRGPDPGEWKRFWRAAKSAGDDARARRDRAMVALLYGLGLRRGEAAGLDLADVDFRDRAVKVLGKGRREKVRLEYSREVGRALEEWLAFRGQFDGPLFVRTDRPGSQERLTTEGVARAVARIGHAAKLPRKVTPHQLRHAAATRLLSGGKTVRDVSKFTRHAKVETVMRYDDEVSDVQGELARDLGKDLR